MAIVINQGFLLPLPSPWCTYYYIFRWYLGSDLLQTCRQEGMIFMVLIIRLSLVTHYFCQVWTSPYWALLFLYTMNISVPWNLINILRYSCWLMPSCRLSLLQSDSSCPFGARPFFVSMDMQNFTCSVMSFSGMLNVYPSLAHLFCSVYLFIQLCIYFTYWLLCKNVVPL